MVGGGSDLALLAAKDKVARRRRSQLGDDEASDDSEDELACSSSDAEEQTTTTEAQDGPSSWPGTGTAGPSHSDGRSSSGSSRKNLFKRVGFLATVAAGAQRDAERRAKADAQREVVYQLACDHALQLQAQEEGEGEGQGRIRTMEELDPLRVLRLVPFTHYLSAEQLYQLAVSMRRVTVKNPGEAFVTEGDAGESMFIVESGAVEAAIDGIGVVHRYQPGEFFGERSVLHSKAKKKRRQQQLGSSTRRTATVRCCADADAASGGGGGGGGGGGASCLELDRTAIAPLLMGPIALVSAQQEQKYRLEFEVFTWLDRDNTGLLDDDESFQEAVDAGAVAGGAKATAAAMADGGGGGSDQGGQAAAAAAAAAALGAFKGEMRESAGFTIDEFAAWWSEHPKERRMLFSAAVAQVREGAEMREHVAARKTEIQLGAAAAAAVGGGGAAAGGGGGGQAATR